MVSEVPVTPDESSQLKNKIERATSVGESATPMATRRKRAANVASGSGVESRCWRSIGVSVIPGQTQLQRTPSAA